MNFNTYNIVALVIVILISFTGCSKKESSVDKKEEIITFAVNITSSVLGNISEYLEMNGDVKSETEVDVYPDMSGKLVGLRVKLGDYITKDQIIADVDPTVPGMIYSLSPVKSTINGTVTDIPRKIGSTVSPQTAVIRAGILNTIEINAYIAEKFIPKIKIGQPVIIKLDAYPDEDFIGQVSIVSPVVDPQTRMMEVKIKPVRIDPRIKPGMFAKLRIITERKRNIVKIPDECVITRLGQSFIFVVDDTLPNSIDKRIFQDFILDKIQNREDETDGEDKKQEDKKQEDKKQKNKKQENQEDKKFVEGLYLYNESENIYVMKTDITDAEKDRYKTILDSIKYMRVKKVIVKLGIQTNSQQEITSGLNANQSVVQRGQTRLEDGSFIRIMDTISPLDPKDVVDIK
jgi:multidrug efflux pump subunit AcrA (membrane-fusion protein)